MILRMAWYDGNDYVRPSLWLTWRTGGWAVFFGWPVRAVWLGPDKALPVASASSRIGQ